MGQKFTSSTFANVKKTHIWIDDFKILNSDYKSSLKRTLKQKNLKNFKRTLIRTLKPISNVKEESICLELCHYLVVVIS